MKKIYGFAALCAAMTLASCSNNDEPIAPVGNGTGVQTVGGYVSVNIANTTKGTRAVDHSNFEYGTEAESKAKKATFVFFNAAGDQVSVVENQDLTSTFASTADPATSVERDYTVMVPVTIKVDSDNLGTDNGASYTETQVNSIDRVVVILNPTHKDGDTTTIDAQVAGKTEQQVLALAADYSTLTGDNEFVMTNSVYMQPAKDGNPAKIVYGQPVAGKIKKSPLEATQNPVDLYVERVVARVDVKNPETQKMAITHPTDIEIWDYVTNNGVTKFDKVDTDFEIVIKGIEVANVANQSFLVKNLEEAYMTTGRFGLWNDADNYRSHWATSWTKDVNRLTGVANGDIKAPSRTETDQADITKTWFKNQAWSSFDSYNDNTAYKKFYVNENTNEDYASALVISAQLCVRDEDGELQPKTFFRTEQDGRYYSEDGAKNTLLNMLQREGYCVADKFETVTKEDGTEETVPVHYRSLDDDDLDFQSAVTSGVEGALGYEGYLEFNDADLEDNVYYTSNGGVDYTKVDNFTATVLHEKRYKVWKWDEGKCYYYIYLTNGEKENKLDENGNAVKDGDADVMIPINGIVRNHIYEVTLTSMAGLGVPVFNPSDVIIPVTPPKITPKDDWSLACNIHILSWARYSQEGIFNQGTDY